MAVTVVQLSLWKLLCDHIAEVRVLLDQVGILVLFLSPYNPELNPAEKSCDSSREDHFPEFIMCVQQLNCSTENPLSPCLSCNCPTIASTVLAIGSVVGAGLYIEGRLRVN